MSFIISDIKDKGRQMWYVGGKAKTLIELKSFGFNVPDFFVISSDIENIDRVQNKIYEAHENIGGGLVAVRSSAIAEDGIKKSFAGQYKTILSVSKDGLLAAIFECIKSANAAHVLSYSKVAVPAKMAVIVQKMVSAETSGVAFSVNPVNNNQSEIIIESVSGLCDSLVSGMIKPNHYIVNKENINESPISNQIKKVANITKEIESKLGYCVDVEWAMCNENLHVLQARPVTTLNNHKKNISK